MAIVWHEAILACEANFFTHNFLTSDHTMRCIRWMLANLYRAQKEQMRQGVYCQNSASGVSDVAMSHSAEAEHRGCLPCVENALRHVDLYSFIANVPRGIAIHEKYNLICASINASPLMGRHSTTSYSSNFFRK